MFKKLLKPVVIFTLSLALLLSVTAMAAAAAPVRLTFGGKSLPVSPILVQDGVTFAPYDALFKALGAKAAYDEASRTITAVSGGTEVVISLDSVFVSVTVDDVSYALYGKSLPIENSGSGRIYVPVRAVAQALGYAVAWDGESRSVVLKTLDDLIAESGATYTVLDKLLAYGGSFMEKSHALSGSFSMSLEVDALFGVFVGDTEGSAAPLTISGTAKGLFDKGGEEMSLKLKTNLADFAAQLSGDEALDAETQAILQQLEAVDIDVIVNGGAGLMYLKSPLVSALADVPEDAWISFETGESGLSTEASDLLGLSGSSDFGAVSAMTAGREGSFRDYVRNYLRIQLLDGDADIAETLGAVNALFSDQAMTRDGDTYTVTMASEPDEDDWYSSSDTMTMTFDLSGGAFQGVSVTYSSESYDEDYYWETGSVTTTELSFSYTAAGHGSLSFTSSVDDVTALELTMDFTLSETTETPAREPAPGSTVISADDIPGVVTPEDGDDAA